jgi:hypothetical protein
VGLWKVRYPEGYAGSETLKTGGGTNLRAPSTQLLIAGVDYQPCEELPRLYAPPDIFVKSFAKESYESNAIKGSNMNRTPG